MLNSKLVYMKMALFMAAVTTIVICGCNSPLQEYLESKKYEAFDIPREKWGIGTIINYENNTETIVALPGDCFPEEIGDEQETDVHLENLSYEVKKEWKLDLNLAKIIDKKVDLNALLERSTVNKVKIKFENPFERVLPQVRAEKMVAEMALDSNTNRLCLSHIANDLTIVRVLGVKGLSYTFYDESNNQVSLDVTLLNLMNIDPSMHSSYVGQRSLEINTTALIGYRVMKVQVDSLPQPKTKSSIRRPPFVLKSAKMLEPNAIAALKGRK